MTRAKRLTKQKANAEISQTRVTGTKNAVARKLCHASYALNTHGHSHTHTHSHTHRQADTRTHIENIINDKFIMGAARGLNWGHIPVPRALLVGAAILLCTPYNKEKMGSMAAQLKSLKSLKRRISLATTVSLHHFILFFV